MQFAPNIKTGEEEVAGYVMLGKPVSQTGLFRGAVEKLLVSPEYCRKGIVRRLMEQLEGVVREVRRTMLVGCIDAFPGRRYRRFLSCLIRRLEVLLRLYVRG